MICVKFTAFCDLRIRLATPRKSGFANLCVEVRRLASLAGQGLKARMHIARSVTEIESGSASGR